MPKKTDEPDVPKPEQKKEEGKKAEETFAVGEVPTATKPMIVDTKTNEVYTILAALAKILNTMEKLETAMLGKTT